MVNKLKVIEKVYRKHMGESDFSKKKELCYKYYEELKEELLTDRIDFCLREFYKRMYNNFIFYGIYQAIETGNMDYMLNAIFQGNRMGTIIANSIQGPFDQSENIIRIAFAFACNDWPLIEKLMPYSLKKSFNGRYFPHYNMIYALIYNEKNLELEAKQELQHFIKKKLSVFDSAFSCYLLALAEKDIFLIEENLQKMCVGLSKANWLHEETYFSMNYIELGRSVALFAHGMYHLAYKVLETDKFKEIPLPTHKSFIKEYEEFNGMKNFPKGENLFIFDSKDIFLNNFTNIDIIPQVTVFESRGEIFHDAALFLKTLLYNMKRNKLIDFEEKEGGIYVFKEIR